jgi:hypothetical protein
MSLSDKAFSELRYVDGESVNRQWASAVESGHGRRDGDVRSAPGALADASACGMVTARR